MATSKYYQKANMLKKAAQDLKAFTYRLQTEGNEKYKSSVYSTIVDLLKLAEEMQVRGNINEAKFNLSLKK